MAGLLLANLLSVAALTLFHYFVHRYHGERVANLALILMLAFPGAIFFNFLYTESLFLLLVMLFFIFLRRKNYLGLTIVGFLLPLTKAIGIFCLAPLAWRMFPFLSKSGDLPARELGFDGCRETKPPHPDPLPHIHGGEGTHDGNAGTIACPMPHRRPGVDEGEAGRLDIGDTAECNAAARPPARWDWRPWAVAWCVLMGYAMYFLLMGVFTGNPFEGFLAQRNYPNQPSLGNIINLPGVWRAFTNAGSFHGSMDSVLDRGFFVLLVASLYGIWKLKRVYFAYALFAGAIPALSTWFFSYSRNVMMCFPLFIVLALLLQARDRRWAFWYYVALLAVLQLFFLVQYLNFRWAG